MFGICIPHLPLLKRCWADAYTTAAIGGFMTLTAFFMVRPSQGKQPLFPLRRISQLFVLYIFWSISVVFTSEFIDTAIQGKQTWDDLYNHMLDAKFYLLEDPFGTLWWLKTVLILTVFSGLLMRLPAQFLFLITFMAMALDDLCPPLPADIRPFVPAFAHIGFFCLGLALGKGPRELYGKYSGSELSNFALAFAAFLFVFCLYIRPWGYHTWTAMFFFLMSILLSHGISRIPCLKRIFCALGPSLFVFFVWHWLIFHEITGFTLRVTGELPQPWLSSIIIIFTFSICYLAYRYLVTKSRILCYLFLIKYQPDSARKELKAESRA